MSEKGYEEALRKIDRAFKSKSSTLILKGMGLTEIPKEIEKLSASLSYLDISSNQISDIYSLRNLPLDRLDISNNKLADVAIISSLTLLKELDCSQNQVSNISPLKSLIYLEKLRLIKNRIVDISGLASLKSLRILYLNSNYVSDLTAVSSLSRLRELYMFGNDIQDLSALANLKQLTRIYAGKCKIKDINPLSDLTKLIFINMAENEIQDISSLRNLKLLQTIYLSRNQIKDISPLNDLQMLRTFWADNNSISDLSTFEHLSNLSTINLDHNQIADISPLASLKEIKVLSLKNNQISNIRRDFFESRTANYTFKEKEHGEGFHFFGNQLQSPSAEVLAAGHDAIIDYFEKIEDEGKDHLYEAKLLVVGEGGSGKTTFCRKIRDISASMPRDDESTKGIDICPISFTTASGEKMQLNIWDFGGQEIYHQTHQFFLTQRSLYVLITDNRRQDTDFNWWLDTILAFGGHSPILIVQNEKGDRVLDLNLKEIIDRYSQVKQAVAVNFETLRGVKDLQIIIEKQASNLEHIGEELPKSWVAIRREIEEKLKTKDYFSLDDYVDLCDKNGINNRDEALRLCQVYHNLGVLLHFADNPVLKHTVILSNEWATDAVYKVLDDRIITDAKGRFSKEDCSRIWCEEQYKEKHDELMELMLKFDLCYRMQDSEQYILPQLLPANQPTYFWDDTENLQVVYRYDEYMPKGIVNRLMARLNWYADIENSWKKGTILTKLSAKSEIREPFGKKEIVVKIKGDNKRELLLFIDEELSRIHRGYSKISVKRMVGCNCAKCLNDPEKQLYDFDALHKRLKAGKTKVECDRSYEEIDVKDVISRTFPIHEKEDKDRLEMGEERLKRKKIFISYSKSDKDYRDRLILYLQQFERNELIESWSDKELIAGEKWDDRIKKELEQSDIILFLCSQDMLSTNYIRQVEMKSAFEKEKQGKVIIIPIIIKPCSWTRDLELSENTALPTKGIPIIDKSWGDQDYAYMNIFEGLEKLFTTA